MRSEAEIQILTESLPDRTTLVSGVIKILGSAARADPTNNKLDPNTKLTAKSTRTLVILPPRGSLMRMTYTRWAFSFMCNLGGTVLVWLQKIQHTTEGAIIFKTASS
jgi:hypothetical protein